MPTMRSIQTYTILGSLLLRNTSSLARNTAAPSRGIAPRCASWAVSTASFGGCLRSRFLPFASLRQGSCVAVASSSSTRLASSLTDAPAIQDDIADDELPPDFPRRDDVLTAILAARRASRITVALQPSHDGNKDSIATVAKADASPVTVADFASQAVVLQHIHQQYPSDSFIAEESSQSLQHDADLADSVLQAASAFIDDPQALFDAIDLGKMYERNATNPSRVWCCDPIDGTKGFLRGRLSGGQYCIAIGLIEDGIPTIGVLACPNLEAGTQRGCIFVASQGGGCYQLPLVAGTAPTVRLHGGAITSPADARFCIGVEIGFGDPDGKCKEMAKLLHEDAIDPDTGDIAKALRIDSQAKYGVIARGGAELYVRLPKKGYREWIWDVAPGVVVLEEAGGKVTDTNGEALDCGLGAQLAPHVEGVLGSSDVTLHAALVNSYQTQEAARRDSE